jgi:DNA replication and repair protein RecF
MWVKKIGAQNIRSFAEFELKLESGLNIFTGPNGAGKTSILEALDVLSRGKSFRSSSMSPIIRFEQKEILVHAHVMNQDEEAFHAGIQYASGQTLIKLNQEKIDKWSQLAAELPIIDIHPESYLLITGIPEVRRKFLAWGAFHVEPSFYPAWQKYHRALKQRNECLKQNNYKEAANWHPVMAETAQWIVKIFHQYTEAITPYIIDLTDYFGFEELIECDFDAGWDRTQSFQKALDAELLERNNTTTIGPHRCDLKLHWQGKKFAKSSSRGQQKVLALAMKLAQASLLVESIDKTPIYLIDELAAELDDVRCEAALQVISSLNAQALITSVAPAPINKFINNQAKWFHVEHGQAVEMV